MARPDLVLLDGVREVRRYPLGGGVLTLGRSSSNDIHLPDEELSRKHCIFEPVGENGIKITDLASANGTFVNARQLGNDPVELKEGDLIMVGSTTLRVGDAPVSAAESVDLGLGSQSPSAAGGDAKSPEPRRPLALRVLWVLLVVAVLGATVAVLTLPNQAPENTPEALKVEQPVVREIVYEKVKADSNGIFRYALSLDSTGVMGVRIDDTANQRRMPTKRKQLSAEALAELDRILAWDSLKNFESAYIGVEPDPPQLDSVSLKVVYSTAVKRVAFINTAESEAFVALRERLEAFSKSELGVWAIAYSRDRLIELAEDAVRRGEVKWNDRDINHGNLFESMSACQEALFYLETVNPKPDCVKAATEGLARAKAELDRRYTDQRFLADRALNLRQWETARDELKVLLEMVPDAKDDRNRDARQKLISAENNLKKGGKR